MHDNVRRYALYAGVALRAASGNGFVRSGTVCPRPQADSRETETEECGRGGVKLADNQPLTSRETVIARLCSEGLQSKEIASRLNISKRTVETHKNNIFRKLGINSTAELIRLMNQRKQESGAQTG